MIPTAVGGSSVRVKALALLLGLGTVATVLLVAGGSPALGGKPDRIIRGIATGAIKDPTITSTKNGQTVVRPVPFLSNGVVDAAQAALGIVNGDDRLEGADATPDMSFSDIGGAKETLGCAKRDGQEHEGQPGLLVPPPGRGGDHLQPGRSEEPDRRPERQPGRLQPVRHRLVDRQRQPLGRPAAAVPAARERAAVRRAEPDNPNNNTFQGDPGTLHTYDAASDPAVAVDSQGNAYFSCVVFDVFTNANGLFVTQSPAAAKGAFYFNMPSSIAPNPSKHFLVEEDNPNGPFAIFRQELHRRRPVATHGVAPDRRQRLRHVDGVLRSTRRADVQPRIPIYGSMSTDGAQTWSTPEQISGSSSSLCFFGNAFDPSPDAAFVQSRPGLRPGRDAERRPGRHLTTTATRRPGTQRPAARDRVPSVAAARRPRRRT